MSVVAIKLEIEFAQITCTCGGVYAITEDFRALKQRKGGGWSCPYCELKWGFFGKTEADKLRDTLARKEKELEQVRISRDKHEAEAKMAMHRERAQKGAKTRLKNRIANGVCPCCTRSFANLQRHMELKHPDFTQVEEVAK